MTIRPLYDRARLSGMPAVRALAAARAYIAGPLADYHAKLAAWESEPDKRRYAPGGFANRPKMPTFYANAYSPTSGPHYTGDGRMVCNNRTLSGLRDCGTVDELFPRLFNHKGWFADHFQNEVWRGRVWQLPARNGECLYLAGYTRPNADDAVLGLRIFREDNPGNRCGTRVNARAAASADSMAERDAEDSREYSERWSEASRHDSEREDARQELKDAHMSARSALRSMRELIAARVSCDAIEETRVILSAKLQRARADMRRAIATIERETAAIAELGMQGEF